MPFGYRKLRNRMMRRKRYRKCAYCGRQLSKRDATLDHIVPKSKGGGDGKRNLTIACYKCNQEKGDKLPWTDGTTTKLR